MRGQHATVTSDNDNNSISSNSELNIKNQTSNRANQHDDHHAENRTFSIGEKVWVMYENKWWPAKIISPETTSEHVRRVHKGEDTCVEFFGDHSCCWIDQKYARNVMSFQEGLDQRLDVAQKSKRFVAAVAEAKGLLTKKRTKQQQQQYSSPTDDSTNNNVATASSSSSSVSMGDSTSAAPSSKKTDSTKKRKISSGVVAQIEDAVTKGVANYDREEYDKAIALLSRAVDMHKGEFSETILSAYFHRGNCYNVTHQYQEAIDDYTVCINEDAASSPITKAAYYSNRGQAYGNMSKYAEAVADYTRAIELNPNSPESYASLGAFYGHMYFSGEQQKGLKEKALQSFENALQIDPKCALAYFNRAHFLMSKGLHSSSDAELANNNKQALEDFNKAIQYSPKWAEAYADRANLNADLGNNEQAVADFQKALELNDKIPFCLYVRNNLGLVYNTLNRFEEAIPHFSFTINRITSLSKQQQADHLDALFTAFVNRGVSYINLKKYDIASMDVREAVRLKPDSEVGHFNLGSISLEMKQFDKAIEFISKSIEINDQDPDFFATRAEAYKGLGDLEKAIADARRACALDPENEQNAALLKSLQEEQQQAKEQQQQQRATVAQVPEKKPPRKLALLLPGVMPSTNPSTTASSPTPASPGMPQLLQQIATLSPALQTTPALQTSPNPPRPTNTDNLGMQRVPTGSITDVVQTCPQTQEISTDRNELIYCLAAAAAATVSSNNNSADFIFISGDDEEIDLNKLELA